MNAVRRTLTTAGLAGLLLLGSAGTALAAASPDPSATATASAVASATPSASPTEVPPASPSAEPSPDPSSGCPQDPQICQSGGGVNTTTDCGQVNDGGVSSPPPPGTVCIAGGLRPGTTAGSGAGTPGQLPRTGPASLLPTLALGSWLVLLGAVAAVAGRRRTARI